MTIELIKNQAIQGMRDLWEGGRSWDFCLTSPPYYGLVDYGHEGQIGHEATVQDYILQIAAVLALVGKGLTDNGILWLNIGDTRSNDSKVGLRGRRGVSTMRRKPEPGTKRGSLVGVPHLLLEHLKTVQGWHHAHTYIWARGSSSQPADGRPQDTHEYFFVLAKSRKSRPQARCTFGDSVVWCASETTDFPCKMPLPLARLMLGRAITPDDRRAVVLDPFIGSGTTAIAADQLGMDCIGLDLDIGPAAKATQSIQQLLISPRHQL